MPENTSDKVRISDLPHYGSFADAVTNNVMFPLAQGSQFNARIGAADIAVYTEQLILSALNGVAELEDLNALRDDFELHARNNDIHIFQQERSAWNSKQDRLVAGENIQIEGDVISATDTVYDDAEIREQIADEINRAVVVESNLADRIARVENLGDYVGSFPTKASLPADTSAFPNGITVNDFTTIQSDETHSNTPSRYVVSAINGTAITWNYDFSYSQDITGKADKVAGATNGNLAGLDASGNLADSGKKASDFAAAAQGAAASTALQSVTASNGLSVDAKSGTAQNVKGNDATTSAKGVVQLNSTTNSTSTTQAATPSAVKAAYDLASGKVTANAAITGTTNTKITYDSKGLVTGGTTLATGDIPSLDAGKITTGTFADARIASAGTWNSKVTASQVNALNTGLLNTQMLGPFLASSFKYNASPPSNNIDISQYNTDAFAFDFTGATGISDNSVYVRLKFGSQHASRLIKLLVRDLGGSSRICFFNQGATVIGHSSPYRLVLCFPWDTNYGVQSFLFPC